MSSSRLRRTHRPGRLILPALAWLLIAGRTPASDAVDAGAVTIGILAGSDARDRRLLAGAERAVARWNAGGGLSGRPVRLSVLETSAPWRDGAGRIARLVFEEGVAGLIGPFDASGAHVAAQIATRGRVPLVVLSPEDSLTRSFDPWIFRGLPGDREQARTVLRRAFAEPAGKRVAVAVPTGRDGRERLLALREICGELGVIVDAIWTIGGETASRQPRPATAGLDAVLLWLDAEPAQRLAELLDRHWSGLLLGSTRLWDTPAGGRARQSSNRLLLPPLGEVGPDGMFESLGYDLVDALLAAAARSDGSPAGIRRSLGGGAIRFDPRGNRLFRVADGERAPREPGGGA